MRIGKREEREKSDQINFKMEKMYTFALWKANAYEK